MWKTLRIAAFALPLGLGGVALAQGSGASGSAGAPGGSVKNMETNDTRTPAQEKAHQVDQQAPALPGEGGATVPKSETQGLPGTGMTTPGSGSTDVDVHKNAGTPSGADQAEPRATEPLERRTDVDQPKSNGVLENGHKGDSNKIDEQRQLERDQLDSDK